MPIDTDTPHSPGWWLLRCARKREARLARLQRLDDYLQGNPPLPEGAENMRDAYRKFQKKSRTNFAELVVESRRERMTPTGFRTAAPNDDLGDSVARKVWDDNGLDVEFADVCELMLGLGDAYMIVGGPDEETGSPLITGEDPRQVVTIHDPARQRIVRAGAKFFHDDDDGRDLAYSYLPADPDAGRETAQVWVAYREVKRRPGNQRITFSPKSWEWDLDLTEELPHKLAPIVRFRNRRGIGEFEHHTDLLDRINHMVLSRMVIAAMQAYRQRAVKNLPTHDSAGKEINYSEVFVADPGAMWMLPTDEAGTPPVELWESQQTDLTPILSAVKQDLEHAAAVLRVPLAQFMPSAMPQSAEGASLAREGLVFVAEDRIKRATEALKDVMVLAFLTMEDADRVDRSKMDVLWAPPERLSLAERADAAVKVAGVVPKRTLRSEVLQFGPQAVERMEAEDAAEALDDIAFPPPVPPSGPVGGPRSGS